MQRPPVYVMLPECYPTVLGQAVHWPEFGLCSKGPATGTRSVLNPIDRLGGNPGREVVMPIRIRCRDRPGDGAQPTEDTRLSTPPADDPEPCYTSRKPKLRMLCGTI